MALLLPSAAITTAVTAHLSPELQLEGNGGTKDLLARVTFGGTLTGGTSIDAYLQTTFDGGATWVDIANFHITNTALDKIINLSGATPVTSPVTPTDGSMASNTVQDGIIGDRVRLKYTSVGTYAAATLKASISSGCRIRS